jgi:transcriptional regulator with XRE-family HTH domain
VKTVPRPRRTRIMQKPEPLSGVAPDLFIEPLGPALRLLRGRRKLRQFQVAEMAGMTKAMLSSYETGSVTPSLLSLSSILLAMKTDLHELQEALHAVAGRGSRDGEDRETKTIPARRREEGWRASWSAWSRH